MRSGVGWREWANDGSGEEVSRRPDRGPGGADRRRSGVGGRGGGADRDSGAAGGRAEAGRRAAGAAGGAGRGRARGGRADRATAGGEVMADGFLPPLHGEGVGAADGWGGESKSGLAFDQPSRPHPAS